MNFSFHASITGQFDQLTKLPSRGLRNNSALQVRQMHRTSSRGDSNTPIITIPGRPARTGNRREYRNLLIHQR
jgi:hypothetical protein